MHFTGDIKADLLCCIALLNSLGKHFPHACSIISHGITTLTESTPYTSKDIHCFLENEQSLLENEQHGEPRSTIALAAHVKLAKLSNTPTCGNFTFKRSGNDPNTTQTMEYTKDKYNVKIIK
jgi:hypothetical protein